MIQLRLTLLCGAAAMMALSSACSPPTETELRARPALEPSSIVFIARTTEPPAYMDALFRGRVFADQAGCLRLDAPGRHTVVWPARFSLDTRGGSVVVLNASGNVVGNVGGHFVFGGGEVTTLPADLVTSADRARAASDCPGRYWMVGAVE